MWRDWYLPPAPLTLFNLSITNRRVQSLVNRVVYRNLACFGLKPFGRVGPLFITVRVDYGPPSASEFNTIFSTAKVEMIHKIHHRALARSGLHYVRTLFLTSRVLPYHPWLGDIASEMTELNQIYFQFQSHSNVADIAYVLAVLARHKNNPRICVDFGVYLEPFKTQQDFFKAFEHEWAQFKTLNIDTLIISFSNRFDPYPVSFFEMIKEITSLKRLNLASDNADLSRAGFSEGFPMSYAATLIGNLPNLELFESNIPVPPLSIPSSLNMLSVPVSRDTLSATFEPTDNITFLDLRGTGTVTHILPQFRTLKTFSLNYYDGDAGNLLDHIFECNPKLVNLSIDDCKVSPSCMSRILSNIQRLSASCLKFNSIQDILTSGQKLTQLAYEPFSKQEFEPPNDVLPLEWLVEAVAKHWISPDLELIQFGIQYISMDVEQEGLSMQDWLESLRGNRFSREDFNKIIMPVGSLYGDIMEKFIIDLRAIARLNI